MVKGDGPEVWASGVQCHPLCLHQTFGGSYRSPVFLELCTHVVCARMRACEL